MVNNPITSVGGGSEPMRSASEQRIVLSYAPPRTRPGLAALLALDETLGAILRTVREPMVAQMRLTWWHDALSRLDSAPPPAQPVLQDVAHAVLPTVRGAELAGMIEGWEELIDPDPLDRERLARFAEGRGAGLFGAGGRLLGAASTDPLADAGRGWALADLAANVCDAQTAALARAMADEALALASGPRWSRQARTLGAMARLAAMPDASPPARAFRALRHRLTGR